MNRLLYGLGVWCLILMAVGALIVVYGGAD